MNPLQLHPTSIKGLSLLNPEEWAAGKSGTTSISTADAYKHVGWFRSALETRASAVVSTPWELTTQAGDVVWSSETEVPPKLDDIANFSTVLYQTELSLLLDGAAFFLKVNRGAGFDGLQYFTPSSMEPVNTPSGLKAWKRTVGSVKHNIDIEAVLYVQVPNPLQEQPVGPRERMSEAHTALVHANVLRQIDTFTANYLAKGLIRPLAVFVPPGTPETEKNRFRTWLKDTFGGADKAANIGVFESGAVAMETLGEGFAELAADELVSLHRQGIANAFRVPSSMLQSKEAANRSVSEQDVRTFYNGTVTPRLRLIEEAFNRQLFKDMKLRLAFHPERLEAFQSAELEKAGAMATLYEKRIVSLNEARAPFEYDDLGPEGDKFMEAPAAPTFALSTNGKSRRSFLIA